MFEKININKETITKIVTILIIAAVVLLTINVLLDDSDSRRQINSGDNATEETLCQILSDIDGVGSVNVMVQYDTKSKVSGVIITAEGADSPIVKNNILNGVSTLFNIPISNVMVFEQKQEVKK